MNMAIWICRTVTLAAKHWLTLVNDMFKIFLTVLYLTEHSY